MYASINNIIQRVNSTRIPRIEPKFIARDCWSNRSTWREIATTATRIRLKERLSCSYREKRGGGGGASFLSDWSRFRASGETSFWSGRGKGSHFRSVCSSLPSAAHIRYGARNVRNALLGRVRAAGGAFFRTLWGVKSWPSHRSRRRWQGGGGCVDEGGRPLENTVTKSGPRSLWKRYLSLGQT